MVGLQTYYTFRLMSGDGEPVCFECAKWIEFHRRPIDIYRIDLGIEKCSCPAVARDCKHMKCANDLLSVDLGVDEFHWIWIEDIGWVEVNDINSVEEMVNRGY